MKLKKLFVKEKYRILFLKLYLYLIRQKITEFLSDIKSKIEEEKSPANLKDALIGLKDFLINVGAGVAAGIIQAKIQGLF